MMIMRQLKLLKNSIVIFGFGMCFSVLSWSGCLKVQSPTFPDRAIVSEEQMTQIHADVKAFIETNTAYTTCVKSSSKRKRAYKEMKRVAKEFNVVLKTYNAKVEVGSEQELPITSLAMK